MRTGAIFRVVGSAFRRRPADLLSLYVLGLGVPLIARVPVLAGVVLVYAYLELSGRLERVATGLAGLEDPPDPEEEPEAFDAWAVSAFEAVEPALTPTVGLILAATLLVAVIVSIVIYAYVAAGQIATCDGRLRGRRGLPAGIAGLRYFGFRFLGLHLLELLLWVVVGGAVVVFAVLFGVVVAAASGDPELGSGVGLIVGALLALLAILPLVVARAIFAFAPVALVVDDVGVIGSIQATLGFVRRRPVEAVVYWAVAVGALGAVGTITSVLAIVGGATAITLLQVLVLVPLLDLLKTAFYRDYRGGLVAPPPLERSLRGQLRDGLARGLREMGGFVQATPGYHAIATGSLLIGVWMGWVAIEPFLEPFESSIRARLEWHIPPAMALEFFGNNWLVALSTAFSGVALGIPAISSLWANGVFFGALGRTEVEPLELLAFVIPHGIFEIPAIIVAGAVGLHLGVAWWRVLRGRIDREAFVQTFERAFWVLVGVGILIAIAAVIEGFVSPYYWRPFL